MKIHVSILMDKQIHNNHSNKNKQTDIVTSLSPIYYQALAFYLQVFEYELKYVLSNEWKRRATLKDGHELKGESWSNHNSNTLRMRIIIIMSAKGIQFSYMCRYSNVWDMFRLVRFFQMTMLHHAIQSVHRGDV